MSRTVTALPDELAAELAALPEFGPDLCLRELLIGARLGKSAGIQGWNRDRRDSCRRRRASNRTDHADESVVEKILFTPTSYRRGHALP
jgi:hypothetical protein